ncbi:MAG: glycosyltransferase [Gemmatimonadetes bacterium]|nr:glycosyltransferase [Gemmatimonadota bacterium]MBT5874525.1 glycosyltransferase [Candidatus Latescibacterota bacterium]MBT5143484.1 glycosyltransferase [Gemmatimonadota bacterium]MBT5589317.1 glycosyltransferase [Gemmatimonadota bacterium]MBT6630465.1 glycosyltransferase [Gemmatimonadota bacterium]
MSDRLDISVVIPTRNQAPRLALVLAGLDVQTFAADRFEVIVVDDGCQDETVEMLGHRRSSFSLRRIGGRPVGRNAARNLGIEAAHGVLTVFLDADALPEPELLAKYWQGHLEHGGMAILTGMQYHLPELEFLHDPRTGELLTHIDVPSVVRDLHQTRPADFGLTERTVREDFDTVRRRGVEGSYPNPGTIERQAQARQLLDLCPRSRTGWLAFIPHNGAITTSLLRSTGGFDAEIPFNEGWELAYRLQRQQGAFVQTTHASTYHLYHYHDFESHQQIRDRYDAIEHMVARHADPRIRMVYFWYAQLWPDPYIPEEAVIPDLLEFDRLYADLSDVLWREYELVLAHHPKELPLIPVEVTYDSCA